MQDCRGNRVQVGDTVVISTHDRMKLGSVSSVQPTTVIVTTEDLERRTVVTDRLLSIESFVDSGD